MSCEPVFPPVPYAIRGVNHKKVQEAAEAAIKWKNEKERRCLIYKRVINGLSDSKCNHEDSQHYVLVIEAINDDGIPWSYIAKVKHFGGNGKEPHVFSVEDVLKNYKKH
ncbi:uncharacterized protein LOC111433339 isoform X2 [Cucurbita moschata]|uniref:Uncharacterized protein LOC111433339 isoform X2 n=1 Tax=Cucurbita moschata TaxID=3662 RepID=A0A6J1EK72_CUCMO|nr:uncharacterized protein LOC111433339 isoform X2 [Cucurbita moschata]